MWPDERPIMGLELIAGDLDDAVVYTERDNIDILIELPTINLVVAIENAARRETASSSATTIGSSYFFRTTEG